MTGERGAKKVSTGQSSRTDPYVASNMMNQELQLDIPPSKGKNFALLTEKGSEPNTVPSTKTDAREPTTKAKTARECLCVKREGRNLVVCIDGTGNQFSPKVRVYLLSYGLIFSLSL